MCSLHSQIFQALSIFLMHILADIFMTDNIAETSQTKATFVKLLRFDPSLGYKQSHALQSDNVLLPFYRQMF